MTSSSEFPNNARNASNYPARPPEAGFSPDANNPTAMHAISARDIFRFIERNWRMFALFSAAAIFLAIVGTSMVSPSFTASATVMFEPNANSALVNEDRGQTVETSARIDSQVEIIKSGRVATAVVQSLSLDKDPSFVGRQGTAASQDQQANIEKAVVALTNKLNVRRIGQSTALEISFASGSAEKAALIANAVAQGYIDVALQDKSGAAQKGASWLEKRLDYLRGQAFNALQEVENFKSVGSGSPADSRVKLAELESVAQSYRQMYDSFLLKYFQTEQLVSYPVADARLLSSATPGLAEKSPKKAAIIVFAAFAGALAGGALALLRQSLNHTIRSPAFLLSDERARYCGAVIHAGKMKTLSSARGKGRILRILTAIKAYALSPPQREDLRLDALINLPPLRVSNDLRRVRSAIFSALPPTKARIIGVSSIERGEGKTAIAANFSALCAASGYRTLLIDACAYNPSASRILAPDASLGLYDAVRAHQSPQRFAITGLPQGFSFLPIGALTTSQSLADLVDGGRDRLGLDELRSAYDIVVIDLPTLSESSDAVSLSRWLDGIILVVQHAHTRQDKYREELGWLASAGTPYVGCVMNKADPDLGKDA
ncbi:exopolysaccharide transport family protein [Hyphomicrobium sp. 99]|uniref:exopolysaccharide transport family protein n=1 Tax=Hyphomicrobium sp. 99 TaxID=1163419 RepID=UPI0018CCE01B|nr:tyrosine-protein kinase domain-containing protein [Hyphomicrobium sp. 99]